MSSTAPSSSSSSPGDPAAPLRLPAAPALVAGLTAAHWLSPDGETEEIALNAALARARAEPPMLCHGPATAKRMRAEPFPAFDLLELFAFVRPARFCPPTPRGLAEALGLTMPTSHAEEALALVHAAGALLRELAAADPHKERDALPIAWTLAQAGWSWGPFVLHALGYRDAQMPPRRGVGLRVWERLPEWQEHAPEPPPGHEPVSAAEARARLAELLGEEAEPRPQQADYASATAAAFQPRVHEDAPHVVLSEAGTGVGKTLGYIAPASVWAEK
ncbi:MAG: ATP-dependent DNA helicase, partial [Rhodovibrionaceae bacterium]|nr:ATP-dependent DNA helicase [Rhodovibrionaceae bacterium]